jgi:hypothetical protein
MSGRVVINAVLRPFFVLLDNLIEHGRCTLLRSFCHSSPEALYKYSRRWRSGAVITSIKKMATFPIAVLSSSFDISPLYLGIVPGLEGPLGGEQTCSKANMGSGLIIASALLTGIAAICTIARYDALDPKKRLDRAIRSNFISLQGIHTTPGHKNFWNR